MAESGIQGWGAVQNREAGFLLIEILVATAILALALLAIGRLQFRIEAEAAALRHETTAWRIAEDRLAELRYAAADVGLRPLSGGLKTFGPPGSGSDEEWLGLERRYSCRWQIERRSTELYGLRVEVDWSEGAVAEKGALPAIVLEMLVDVLPVYRPVDPASGG